MTLSAGDRAGIGHRSGLVTLAVFPRLSDSLPVLTPCPELSQPCRATGTCQEGAQALQELSQAPHVPLDLRPGPPQLLRQPPRAALDLAR